HISPPIDDTVSVKKSSSSPEFSSDLDKQHMLAMVQKRFYSILHSKLLALINEFSECPYPYQSRINPTFINCLGQQIFLTSNYRLLNQYFDLLKSLTKHHQKMVLDVLCQVREESVTMANEIALSLDNELTKENKHPNRI